MLVPASLKCPCFQDFSRTQLLRNPRKQRKSAENPGALRRSRKSMPLAYTGGQSPMEVASMNSLTPIEPLTVTVPEAIRLTGLGRTSLYRLIGERKLRHVKVGKRTLIDFSSIKRLIEGTQQAA
jgi:excisionase family DNA binding protein